MNVRTVCKVIMCRVRITWILTFVWIPAIAVTCPTSARAADNILPSGRRLTPAGRLIATPNFAINVVASGSHVAVAASGANSVHSLSLYQESNLKAAGRFLFIKGQAWWRRAVKGISHQSLFQGMAAGPSGLVYLAGGCSDDILVMHVADGRASLVRRINLHGRKFPATQYPYEYQGVHGGARLFYSDSVALGEHRRHLYATGLLSNSLAKINLGNGRIRYANVGPMPFQVVTADHGRRLVISDWGADRITILSAASLKVLGKVSLGPKTGPANSLPGVHPTAMAALGRSATVWVACANTDVLVQFNARTFKTTALAVDLPYRGAPPGTFPDALAVWKHYLFAANSGNNDVAVFDNRSGKLIGLIPTAWYPTSVAVAAGRLFVACAKGLGSGPGSYRNWIGDCMDGSLQSISLKHLRKNIPVWTRESLTDNGFTAEQRAALQKHNAAVAAFLHRHIHHVVFILRENKTFDEDFGDYKPAGKWADPHLDLYNARELPNLYRLAKRFALCANFYVDGEVTAQGHQWTTSAEDSDFVQRTWPMYYSGRGMVPGPGWTQSLGGNAGKTGNGFGNADNPFSASQNLTVLGHWSNPWVTYPQGMFLFNDLLSHHKSFRDFGEFASRDELGDISAAMRRHISAASAAWNLFILDTNRSMVVMHYIAHHRQDLPQCMYIWLPDDHTAGGTPGYYTPDYYVANNDLATGQIIAALSRLPSWRHTLVIITEDDAQSGADHIDAHRSLALLVSPWIRPGSLVTHRYSQIDLTKTIETVCRIPAMSQWDANGRLISGIWLKHPDMSPFKAAAIRVKQAVNRGSVSAITRLRRRAGKDGQWLSPQWLKLHHAAAYKMDRSRQFTPTKLLKIPGPEQMRQEWIVSKGTASYENVMAYIGTLAKKEHRPISDFIATTDADDGK